MLLAAMPSRFDGLERRVATLEGGLEANTTLTRVATANTLRIVAFVEDIDVVWRFCKLLRRVTFRVAKWSTAIALAVTSALAAVHAVGAVDVIAWLRALR